MSLLTILLKGLNLDMIRHHLGISLVDTDTFCTESSHATVTSKSISKNFLIFFSQEL